MPAVARSCGSVPKGGGGRHGGGSPLRPSGSPEQKAPRWPQPGPLCRGHRGGSRFQFSTGARDRRLLEGEAAKCGSACDGIPASHPWDGAMLSSGEVFPCRT